MSRKKSKKAKKEPVFKVISIDEWQPSDTSMQLLGSAGVDFEFIVQQIENLKKEEEFIASPFKSSIFFGRVKVNWEKHQQALKKMKRDAKREAASSINESDFITRVTDRSWAY